MHGYYTTPSWEKQAFFRKIFSKSAFSSVETGWWWDIHVYTLRGKTIGEGGVGRVQILCEGETRFLGRKLCKELYTAVAGLYGLYDIEGDFGKLRFVKLKFVRPVDMTLV